jgi:ABC-2 type transport system ATP-binding protein
MTDYAIEANDVVKRYPFARTSRKGGRNILKAALGLGRSETVALNGASFHVRKGETFGLLGPNGAGKTTMIKILSTILTFEGGEVKVNGIDILKHPNQVVRNLQTVLTGSLGFEWRLSAKQSLRFYATLYGLSKKKASERIESLIDAMDLRGYENVMYQRFSSGMGRRLLLARALLIDVPILLFDEPTANLDPVSAVRFRRVVRDLSVSKGKTVLLTTHNMFEAQDLCDTIAIIDKGRVIAMGTPTEVRRLIGRQVKIELGVIFADDSSEKEFVRQLESVPLITKVTFRQEDDKKRKIVIEAQNEIDINSLLKGILSSGAVVQTLETSYPSLEDAFVRLTAGASS